MKVKKTIEGWINIYPHTQSSDYPCTITQPYFTKDLADRYAFPDRIGAAYHICQEYEIEEIIK